MNHFEEAFSARLNKFLTEQLQTCEERLLDGSAQSFDDYRERVGRRRALTETQEQMEIIKRQLDKGE